MAPTSAHEPRLLRALDVPDSPARVRPSSRPPFRIAAVQLHWHADPAEHEAAVGNAVRLAAAEGARLVCLPELTLSRYFPATADGKAAAEGIPDGPTCRLVTRLAQQSETHVMASLYEKGPVGSLGYDTAVVASPAGRIVSRTRKLHIPRTTGYHEDRHFSPGPPTDAYPLLSIDGVSVGFPTCWDQWFPELARAYALSGAEILVYPTAIGSEPDHPAFDTAPLWEQVIVANGIMNGLFMVAVNRVGNEGTIRFYGSSFISDPYGRKLLQAPRDEAAILIADLDLDQRRDWLELFPLLDTRRPEAYGLLAMGEAVPRS